MIVLPSAIFIALPATPASLYSDILMINSWSWRTVSKTVIRSDAGVVGAVDLFDLECILQHVVQTVSLSHLSVCVDVISVENKFKQLFVILICINTNLFFLLMKLWL